MNFLKYSIRFVRPIRFNSQVQLNTRTLFTAETLDLISYQKNRQDAINNVVAAKKFKWELQAYVENEKDLDAIRLKEALEVMAHLVQPELDDVNLMRKTLYAINSIENVTDIAKRSIGNVVMKALYTVNIPSIAIELYSDPKLNEFFGGFKCTLICLDLLYTNGKYNEILKIDLEKRQQLWSAKTSFSKFIDVLVFGAAFKLNTIESLNYAQKLWSNVSQSTQFRRSVSFVTLLALNQAKPSLAVEWLQHVDCTNITEQIKLLALADLGHANEIIEALQMWDSEEKFCEYKVSIDVLERIQQQIKRHSTVNTQAKFVDVYEKLVANNRVTHEALTDLLNRPISSRISFRGKRSLVDDLTET